MKVLIGLGHPAHFHLFLPTIRALSSKGLEFVIVISDKDILKNLLEKEGIGYYLIAQKSKKNNLLSKAIKIFRSTFKLNKIIHQENPDLLLGCLTQIAFSGFFKRKPVYFFGEDDLNYTFVQVVLIMPFIKKLIAPKITRLGMFSAKKLAYDGYQKLAYLHPNIFDPNPDLINKEVDLKTDYFLIRLVGLSAYHDQSVKGINDEIMKKLIEILSPHGTIYITSERVLPEWLKQYQLKTDPSLIHHVMAFSKIFIGDSQSMTVESAMLGVPSIRFNDFAGRISLLEELEHKYKLTFSIPTSKPDKLFAKLDELLAAPDLRSVFIARKQKMLSEKIDVTAFFSWLIENYPESIKQIKKNPEVQHQFK